jgi:predicted TIM-barrel fold metal-dependent hydrolase
MKFIDAHHHLWIPDSYTPDLGYRWLRDIGAPKPFGDPTAIQRNYEWPEFASESQHSLAGSVYLQVDGAIADPVAETAWVQSVFEKTGLRHAIVGLVDLSSQDADQVLARQGDYPMFTGVRQIISRLDAHPSLCFAPEHFLRNARWCDQFQLLIEHNLSFDLQLYPEQMGEAADLLARYPEVPVIVDHAGSPYDQTRDGLNKLLQGFDELAQLDQVSIKLCGFGMFDQQRNAQSISPIVEGVLEKFGADRVMFGSNFPVDKLMGSYDEVMHAVVDNLQHLSVQQREAVMHDNAVRVYKL